MAKTAATAPERRRGGGGAYTVFGRGDLTLLHDCISSLFFPLNDSVNDCTERRESVCTAHIELPPPLSNPTVVKHRSTD
jgi:hypothetical protein